MKLGEIYELFIKKGLEKDPRTRAGLKRELARVKKEYSKLKPQDKKYFDKERLKQPYADTRILFGDKNKEIRTIMVGVDIDSSEILTAYPGGRPAGRLQMLAGIVRPAKRCLDQTLQGVPPQSGSDNRLRRREGLIEAAGAGHSLCDHGNCSIPRGPRLRAEADNQRAVDPSLPAQLFRHDPVYGAFE